MWIEQTKERPQSNSWQFLWPPPLPQSSVFQTGRLSTAWYRGQLFSETRGQQVGPSWRGQLTFLCRQKRTSTHEARSKVPRLPNHRRSQQQGGLSNLVVFISQFILGTGPLMNPSWTLEIPSSRKSQVYTIGGFRKITQNGKLQNPVSCDSAFLETTENTKTQRSNISRIRIFRNRQKLKTRIS